LSSPRSLQQSNNSHNASNFSLNGSSHSTPRNGHAGGFAQQKSTGTLFSQTSNLNLDSESTPTSTLTIRSYPTEFWCSILDNPTTTVMVSYFLFCILVFLLLCYFDRINGQDMLDNFKH